MALMKARNMRRALALVATAALLAIGSSGLAAAAPPRDTSGTANGIEITARWWQVVVSDFSIFEDSMTGGNCRVTKANTGSPVVIAAGTFGGASGPRACSIPANSTLVLPAINSIWAMTDPVPLDTIGEGRTWNRDWAATASGSATVDGADVGVKLIASSRFTVPGEVFGLSGLLPAVSIGHWLVVKLPRGTHTVTTHGENSADGFMSETSYTFNVG